MDHADRRSLAGPVLLRYRSGGATSIVDEIRARNADQTGYRVLRRFTQRLRILCGSEAIGMILERILPPMVKAVKARLQRGETVLFGPVGLSATAITWKGKTIPVSQITRAEIVGTNLRVKQQGKWLATLSVRSDKVPNVLVFLDVLESLAPQIKSTGIDPLARVRM